jgi:hypothetical protein
MAELAKAEALKAEKLEKERELQQLTGKRLRTQSSNFD